MKCDECNWDYPFEYLSPLVGNKVNRANVCGICALKLINEIHGMNRNKFDGEMAEQMRQNAIKWRKSHENTPR